MGRLAHEAAEAGGLSLNMGRKAFIGLSPFSGRIT